MDSNSSGKKQHKLPNGWILTVVKDVIDKIPLTGIKLKQKDYLGKGKLPVIDQGQTFIGGYTNKEELKVLCELPVIVFGDHTKKFKYVDFKFVAGADGIKVLKPLELFYPKLFYYFLQTIQLPEKGYARHFQFLEKSTIPLPPLPEQHRIVAKIEEVFSDLDAGVDALKKIKEQLKRYRQAVLKYAFEGKLTGDWRQRMLNDKLRLLNGEHNNSELKEFPELPEGWVWTRLEEVTKIASGGTPSTRNKVNFGGKIPWITPSDLSKFNGKYISKGSRNITEKGLNSSSAVLLPAGAVIFSSRAPIGYVAIAKNEFCTNQGCKNFIPKKGIFNEYLYYYLKGNKSLAESYASGTTFLELSASRAAFVPIPISPIQEQHKIVEEIERRFSVADEIEKVVDYSLKQSGRLKKSILKKAFEGKLVPQDPNDEPVGRLLEQIKAEKERVGFRQKTDLKLKTTKAKRR